MRRLDISDYEVADADLDVAEPHTYHTRWALGEVLLAQSQGHTAMSLLEHEDLVRKIRDHEGDIILLEEAEYLKIRAAFDKIEGFSRYDVEMVRRVVNAEEVAVVEEEVPEAADN